MTQEDRSTAVRLVQPARYNRPSESAVIRKQIRQHNEAFSGRGLYFLRSFLSNVSGIHDWQDTKQVLAAVNGSDPASAVKLVKPWLAHVYPTPDEQFIAGQAAMFVKKYPFPANTELATQAGTAKFLRGERRNRLMNALAFARRRAGVWDPFIESMKRYLSNLLGDKPDLRDISAKTGWGPGANVGVNGQFTNFARKLLAEEWTVTPAALPFVLTAAKRSPMFWELLGLTREGVVCVDPIQFEQRFMAKIKIVDYNNIAFAEKDADEFRTIASEPLLNSWYQKGLEVNMKLRLRRFGIDLRHQEPNQEMAREGSLGGYNPYCTIDLSNASGSIYTELCRECFPAGWFEVFNCVRSPAYRMPSSKTSVKYQGFMSMGNGFCFPLMTSLIAAICAAAHDYTGTAPDFRVYGDDIIVRQNEALVVLEKLRYLGFKANTDKTFIIGPFRESCGADWHSGQDVRPIYLDTPLESFEERVRIHNAFCRLPNRWGAVLASACSPWFKPSFTCKFVRPFAGDTDEAIDGRHQHWVGPRSLICRNFDSPAWYGLSFNPVKDDEIEVRAGYNTALMYAALQGVSSEVPFSARRETKMRVARFSHSGNTSNWLPMSTVRFSCGSALIGHALAELQQ